MYIKYASIICQQRPLLSATANLKVACGGPVSVFLNWALRLSNHGTSWIPVRPSSIAICYLARGPANVQFGQASVSFNGTEHHLCRILRDSKDQLYSPGRSLIIWLGTELSNCNLNELKKPFLLRLLPIDYWRLICVCCELPFRSILYSASFS